MTDHAELRRVAEAATPGPWSCNRHWAIVGGPILEFTNGAAQQQIAMACGQSWMRDDELRNNAEFIAANNPKTVLALLDEIDRLKAENDALRKFSAEAYQVLGALDAPENVLDNASDAANGVPLRHETLLPFFAEDYEALCKDAARYRWLRERDLETIRQGGVFAGMTPENIVLNQEDLDAAIDAALEGATQ
ncbi:TPA: ead/Ea22-like family protein [Pseudomonas aeruginosa]|nr:ead/Ea22-like family protein [Pseudomonas aeruginosa]HCC6599661.1 ead/Ea22-like family protein [Pseudomonas aeruginosa]HEP9454810.1 ead/Ea22-like family protein [Pseudomonas aeruginosa]